MLLAPTAIQRVAWRRRQEEKGREAVMGTEDQSV